MKAGLLPQILLGTCLLSSGGYALAGGGSPSSSGATPQQQYVEFFPVNEITLHRGVYTDGKAIVSGVVDTPQSPLQSVTVSGVNIPVSGNRFAGVVDLGSNQLVIRARNASGGQRELPVSLGDDIQVKLSRAVRDYDVAKIRGTVLSDSDVVSLSVGGHGVAVDAEGRFNAEIGIAPGTPRVDVIARNSSGGQDQFHVDFSETAPEHGLTIKLQDSGLDQLSDILETVVDDIVPGLSGTLVGLLDGLGGSGGDSFANGTYDIHSTQVTITSNSSIELDPAPNDEKAGVAANVVLQQLALQTTVYAKGCVFWVICPEITLPINTNLNGINLHGNLLLGKGIPEPADNAKFAEVSTDLVMELERIEFPSVGGVLGSIIEAVVNTIARPLVKNLVGQEISNLANTEINKILSDTVPTSIPALITDNDNGVGETIDQLGILPLFKILVRGIGATIGVSDSFSTSLESALSLDANLVSNTSDSRVKFGYISRDIPNSDAFLKSIQPTDNVAFDALLVIDADVLNKSVSVLTQASLMDFTIPSVDINTLTDNPGSLLDGKDINLRVRSKDGSPYFSVPDSDGDLIKLELNDYVLELRVDDQLIVEVNLDVVANANMKIVDNRFSIPLLDTQSRIRGVKLGGRDIPANDPRVAQLINSMGTLAADNVLKVVEVLPLPVIPGNKMISLSTWRIAKGSSDIALAVRLQDANAETSETTTAGTDTGTTTEDTTTTADSGVTGPAADVGIVIPREVSDVVNGIGSILTVITDEPLDLLPTENYDTIDPNANKPHVPAINRQTIAIKDNQYTRPHMPDVRVTQDGRLGVGAFATALTLMKPEKVAEGAFVAQEEAIVLSDQRFEVGGIIRNSPLSKGTLFENNNISNHAICDPDVQYLPDTAKQNPYACGVNGEDDCYDINIISEMRVGKDFTLSTVLPIPQASADVLTVTEAYLTRVPMTVRVANPKTSNASIVEATVSAVPTHSRPLSGLFFEMNAVLDGRLFVTRIAGRALTWYNERTDEYVNGTYDSVYGVIPETAEPCDVTAFESWKPLTHAPYDEEMKRRYKFAAYPFRDPSGAYYPDGGDIKGTYPWISRDGSMIGFSALGTPRLFPKHHINPGDTRSRYPSRCLDDEPNCSVATRADVQFRSLDAGIMLGGLWTQGKMFLVDSLINEVDFKFGGGRGDVEHSLVQLYEPNTGKLGNESGEIEMGETRENSTAGGDGTKLGNGTIFDSPTNLLNFWPTARPATPRDVVWTFNTGRQTDEVAFDDYLNPNGLIVSHMVGAMEYVERDEVEMMYYDGWNQAAVDFVNPVRVQNSATALPEVWNIPRWGEVHFGRLEPSATGGVKGKGMWFDGDRTYISYDLNKQPQNAEDHPWFINLFIDPRFSDTADERSLVHFSDGTSLTITGNTALNYRNASGIVRTVTLPKALENISWTQIALQTRNGGKSVSLYIDGFPVDHFESDTALFLPKQGRITLAGTAQGSSGDIKPFRGWMDDFKVFAELTNPEVVCNHANGILVGLPESYTGDLKARADLYAASSHALLSRILKGYGRETYNQYACFLDNTKDYGANLLNIPSDVVSVREDFLFPEGPLFHAKPRPDSLNNNFCLSCHHAQGQGGLGLDALDRRLGIEAKHDRRRQPMQPHPKVGGNLPADWLPYSASFSQQTAVEGIHIDELLLASGYDVTPEVKGLTLVDVATGFDIMPVTDGANIDLASLPAQIALRFAANGVTQSVSYTINGNSGSLESPYAVDGVTVNQYSQRRFNQSTLAAGSYTVTAYANGATEDQLNINFSVAGTAPVVTVVETETTDTTAETESSVADQIFQAASDLFDAVVDFFSGLVDSVKEAIFGDDATQAEADASRQASADLHNEIWNAAEKNLSLTSFKSAQIYFPNQGMCAEMVTDANNGDGSNGRNVVLAPCHGGANQLWHSDDSGRIFSRIGSSADSKNWCLDGSGMADTNNVLVWSCHDQTQQKWTLDVNGFIKAKDGQNVCLYGWNDRNVLVRTCGIDNGRQRVQWREPQVANYTLLSNKATGQCMTALAEENINNRTVRKIADRACNHTDVAQAWEFDALTRKLRSKVNPRLCLQRVHTGQNEPWLMRCEENNAHQKWSFDGSGNIRVTDGTDLALRGNGNANITMVSDADNDNSKWNNHPAQYFKIHNQMGNRCIAAAAAPEEGVRLESAVCDNNNSWAMRWSYDYLTGEIRSGANDEFCMTVAGAFTNHTQVNLHRCHGGANQKFDYIDGHIALRTSPSYVLRFADNGVDTKLDIEQWVNYTNQSWKLEPVLDQQMEAPELFVMRNVNNGSCIEVPGNDDNLNNGVRAQLWDCDLKSGRDLWWHYDKQSKKVHNFANPRYCLDNLGGSGKIGLWECNGVPANQQFNIVENDINGSAIRLSANTGQVFGTEGTHRGAWIHLYDHHGGNNQLWRTAKLNFRSLKNVLSGHCMELTNASRDNGANVRIAQCNGQDKQKWWHDPRTNYLRSAVGNMCLDNADQVHNGGRIQAHYCVTGSHPNLQYHWSAATNTIRTGRNQNLTVSAAGVNAGNDVNQSSYAANLPQQMWVWEDEAVPTNLPVFKPLKNKVTGLCLEVQGASTANGANMVASSCNGSAAQGWYYNNATRQLMSALGTCADHNVPSAAHHDSNIFTYACDPGNHNQKFNWDGASLRNVHNTAMVMTVRGWESGSNVNQWHYVDSGKSEWVFVDNYTDAVSSKYDYRELKTRAGGTCLNVQGGNNNGTNVNVESCNGSINQKWWYNPATRYMHSAVGNKCLDNVGGGNAHNGGKVQIWDCVHTSHGDALNMQVIWNGESMRTPHNPNVSIDAQNGAHGANVHQWQYVGVPQQHWYWQN